MVKRIMQDYLAQAGKGFPVITITGPRQSGKTTLAKLHYPNYLYYDLEDPEIRTIMRENPKALLGDSQEKYIIDEFQLVPELLSYIKVIVDRMNIPAQFVLTGSNQFTMMNNLSQSLAGRTAIFQLLPFSYREVYGTTKSDLNEVLYKGFYPRLIDMQMDAQHFYTAYIKTYLERDIRLISNVKDLNLFHTFLGLCAGRTGALLNKSALANETGIDIKTVNNWLSLLQTSFVIHLLQPWYTNINKRLVKSAKLYFYDTGLVCRLLHLRGAADLVNHPLRGQIFETFVVSEQVKSYYNQGLEAPLYFYRDSGGTEVDLIIQNGQDLMPCEIKSAGSFHPSFLKNIESFRTITGSKSEGMVIYGGDNDWEIDDVRIKPYYV